MMFNSRQLRRMAIAVIAILVTILIPITHSTASDVPFYWDSINVEMDVQPNGDIWVTETQHYVFTDDYTNERYRYIPLNKVDGITDVTVTENGQPLAPTTGIENNQLWIRWQHPLNPPESHVFVLKYRVIGGIQVNRDKSQVYWKAIFADRQVPVLSGTVTVHLPEVLSGQVLGYTSYGIPATRRSLDGKTFEFVASQALPPGDELEVLIIFPSSVLNLPQPQWQQVQIQQQQFSQIKQFFVSMLMILLLMLFSLPFIGIFIAFISMPIRIVLARRCPRCRKLTLKTRSQVLVYPTSSCNGRKRVTQHCNNCSYHHTVEQTIPYTTSSYSGGIGGGGCGGGGGGGGGG